MKKTLLFLSFVFSGVVSFSQIYSDNAATANTSNQTSVNIAKTSYLTNGSGKLMQAYPNPAIDEVTVQHVASADKAFISVISPDGRILEQKTVVANTLQTSLHVGNLSKGLYILRFDNGKGDIRTLQLVKN